MHWLSYRTALITQIGIYLKTRTWKYSQELDYIRFCMGNVTVDKNIRVFPNQKPWMNSQVRTLLRACDAAFRSGNRALYNIACADLKEESKKVDYKRRIESHLSSSNSWQVWQGLQNITNYRGSDVTAGDLSVLLAEELNCFFARFEKPQQHSSSPTLPPPGSSNPPPHSLLRSMT